MLAAIKRFIRSDDAAITAEYAFLITSVLCAVVATISVLGNKNLTLWSSSAMQVTSITPN